MQFLQLRDSLCTAVLRRRYSPGKKWLRKWIKIIGMEVFPSLSFFSWGISTDTICGGFNDLPMKAKDIDEGPLPTLIQSWIQNDRELDTSPFLYIRPEIDLVRETRSMLRMQKPIGIRNLFQASTKSAQET